MSKSPNKDSFENVLALSDQEVKMEILKNKKTLFQFRFQAAGEKAKPHVVKAVRRRTARLKTALSIKNFESTGK
jgi:ribosomal protein L29